MFWWIFHMQMNMITFTVTLNKLSLELVTNIGKDIFHHCNVFRLKYFTPVLGNKHQVTVKGIDAMITYLNFS